MSVECFVPLPVYGCSGNTVKHWRVRQQARKQYRTECFYTYKEAKLPKMEGLCWISLTFYNGPTKPGDRRYRPRDESNGIEAAKSLQDALVDAGIIQDDTRKYLRQGPVEILGTKKEHGGRAGVLVKLRGEEDG